MVTYPADWIETEFIKFAIDMADGPFGSNLKAEHYTTNKEVRIVQLSNIGENGWKDENTKYTTFSHAELIKRSKVNPGDIIIAKMMPAGRSIMCPDKEKGYILSSDAVKVVVDITKAFPQFVVYAMKGKFYQRQISDQIQGSTRARTSISKLKKNTILMPSYPEQQAIASTLSLFDTHIDNLTELIEKKKAIRDGALEDLVSGKTRLAGFDGEWEEKTIDEFVKIQRGASPRPIENYLTLNAEGVNWIKIGDATKHGKYIDSTEERITPQGAMHSVKVCKGDFILSNSMSFGRPYILDVDGCIHDGWLRLFDFQANANSDFLYYLLSSLNVQRQYESFAAGSGIQNLNKEVVKKVTVMLPSIPEQEAIASVLSSMDEEITALTEDRDKMMQIREGAVDDLLTGRVRLNLKEV